MIWYFAYGANMCRRTFVAQRRMAPLSAEAARLDGYRLRFSEPGPLRYVEEAFANIEHDPDGSVHGVLYRLSEHGLARLDRSEGEAYEHAQLPVWGERCGAVTATVYRSPHRVRGRRPSRRYRDLLVQGAREHALPDAYIAALAAEPAIHVPIVSALIRTSMPLVLRLRELRVRGGGLTAPRSANPTASERSEPWPPKR